VSDLPRCSYCGRQVPPANLDRGRCLPGQDCAAHRLIREAAALGNGPLVVGLQQALVEHRRWWDTDEQRQREAEWEAAHPKPKAKKAARHIDWH